MQIREIEDLIFRYFPFEPTEGQRILILALAEFIVNSAADEVFLFKGYAGSGKTTLLSALVKAAPFMHKNTILLAPTGRAAKVLAGYSGKHAFTLHKKLYQPRSQQDGSVVFARLVNYHKETLFIVDEASMIHGLSSGSSLFSETDLLTDLIEYVQTGKNCRLILIGDTAQLPPVGLSVSPALEPEFLKNTYRLKTRVIELKEVMRQASWSGILANATFLRIKLADQSFKPPFLNLHGDDDIRRLDGSMLEDELNDAFGRGGGSEAIVITSSNKRANIYNQEIRRRVLYREEEISAGDMLMVVKNNYFWLPAESPAGFIANGDLVEVLKVKRISELYGFRFATAVIRMVDYPEQHEIEVNLLLNTLTTDSPALTAAQNQQFFDEVMKDYDDVASRRGKVEKVKKNPWFNALQVKFAYALTCHKTQGGQWDTVFIDQPWLKDDKADVEFLRWLYTALTRATSKVFLINFKNEFFYPDPKESVD